MATEPCMLSAQIWTRAMYWSGAQNSIYIYIYIHAYVCTYYDSLCLYENFICLKTYKVPNYGSPKVC